MVLFHHKSHNRLKVEVGLPTGFLLGPGIMVDPSGEVSRKWETVTEGDCREASEEAGARYKALFP